MKRVFIFKFVTHLNQLKSSATTEQKSMKKHAMSNYRESKINSNTDEKAIAVIENVSSSDESETDSSIVESVSNGNEAVPFELPRMEPNIGHIVITTSNDVTIGNRIIYNYNGPVTIHQNHSDQQRSDSNVNLLVDSLNRSGEF